MLALALGCATAMARVPAGLPAGVCLTDHISLGVIARTFPIGKVRRVLAETCKASERERDLPPHVVVHYAIALALYAGSGTREVLRCLLKGPRWLWDAEAVRVAGKSGISQVRTRLSEAPLRRLPEGQPPSPTRNSVACQRSRPRKRGKPGLCPAFSRRKNPANALSSLRR